MASDIISELEQGSEDLRYMTDWLKDVRWIESIVGEDVERFSLPIPSVQESYFHVVLSYLAFANGP